MDGTPLKHLAFFGKNFPRRELKMYMYKEIWTKGKTGTLWLDLNGDIVLFHTTIKGKTDI